EARRDSRGRLSPRGRRQCSTAQPRGDGPPGWRMLGFGVIRRKGTDREITDPERRQVNRRDKSNGKNRRRNREREVWAGGSTGEIGRKLLLWRDCGEQFELRSNHVESL